MPSRQSRSAIALTALVALIVGCAPREPSSVLLVMVDTLRADHLGAYGYQRDTSPNIDRMAAESYLFEDVMAVSPWTNPSIGTLFTGRNPQSIWPPSPHGEAIKMPLPGQLPTLAERFSAAGFQTAALVDHPGISKSLGFSRGFGQFRMLYAEGGFKYWQNTDAVFVRKTVRSTLEKFAGEPFFLYLHLVYPHQPYIPPPPHQGLFGEEDDGRKARRRRDAVPGMANAYDAEIHYTDSLLGEMLADLAILGLDRNTWVVLVSDHGEAFGEHGTITHGDSFFNEVLSVPLIMRPPGGLRDGRRIATPVSVLDLFPTLLDIAGVEVPAELRGQALLAQRSLPPDRWLFSESPNLGDIRGAAVRRGEWKYIEYGKNPRSRRVLINLREDPREDRNQSGTVEQEERLAQSLEQHLEASEMARSVLLEQTSIEVDSDTVERLRALGYID